MDLRLIEVKGWLHTEQRSRTRCRTPILVRVEILSRSRWRKSKYSLPCIQDMQKLRLFIHSHIFLNMIITALKVLLSLLHATIIILSYVILIILSYLTLIVLSYGIIIILSKATLIMFSYTIMMVLSYPILIIWCYPLSNSLWSKT